MLFGTFTHRKNRDDINALVTPATYLYYSQLSKRSHLQLVSCVAKTRTNIFGCKHIAPTEQPLQFQSVYYLNKSRISLI